MTLKIVFNFCEQNTVKNNENFILLYFIKHSQFPLTSEFFPSGIEYVRTTPAGIFKISDYRRIIKNGRQ